MNTVHKNYYAIIPANIRYDDELTPNAKLLYGEITALCNEKGYCWASNSYFAELYNVSVVSISKWINQLIDKSYLSVEMVYRDGTNQIQQRNLRIATPTDEEDTPIKENFKGVLKKSLIPPQRKVKGGIKEKFKDNNTFNNTFNNTSNIYSSSCDERQPLSLVDDVQPRSDKAKEDTSKKEKAKQLDKDFEALWKLYPNKKGKAKAKKAYIKAIKDGVTNKQIQDGIVAYTKEIKAKNTDKEYIKHGSTWFNNRAWEDEYDTTPNQPKRYGQSNYQEPVPEHMQEEVIDESDVDLELDDELFERIRALTDKNNKSNDSP